MRFTLVYNCLVAGVGVFWMFVFSIALYIAVIYYLIFNTDKVVDYNLQGKRRRKGNKLQF